MELLPFIDVAVVSERFCEQMQLSPAATLDLLKHKGCRIGGVTRASAVFLVRRKGHGPDDAGARACRAREIVDTNGAGDVFHGAYVYSYLARPRADVGGAFPLCARGVGACDPLSRQRSAAARRSRDVETAERRFQPLHRLR